MFNRIIQGDPFPNYVLFLAETVSFKLITYLEEQTAKLEFVAIFSFCQCNCFERVLFNEKNDNF